MEENPSVPFSLCVLPRSPSPSSPQHLLFSPLSERRERKEEIREKREEIGERNKNFNFARLTRVLLTRTVSLERSEEREGRSIVRNASN